MKKFVTPYCLLAGLLIFSFSCSSKDSGNESTNPEEAKKALTSTEGLELHQLKLPPGFKIDVYARVKSARSMALGSDGTVFIGTRGHDKIYAVRDTDGDYKADEIYTIAEGLRNPNGVAFKDGNLYIAEISKLWRYPNIESTLNNPYGEIIYDDYPQDGHHGWKYIAFGPDGKLYVPVGAPCNICESKNEIYASITRINPDGTGMEIFAKGIRNSVGFTWHPTTGELYFTDNGRDMLGDDIPPCELNRATTSGQHFGYPYCHGGSIKDPEFGDKYPCSDFKKPVQNLGPHVAPLGLKFYTENMFPAEYKNTIFIAEHGSWNRSKKIGYRITMVKERNGVGQSYTPFITGWLNEATQSSWGRPVDVLILPDGSMLISDDQSGTIYRVTYKG
ncbi:sorbosone dehydrogenase family protein [Marinoscillum sp. MHG1-6]|uniref:PQQ-dependent sugar dehydrogenase n=1 Tax=Marinoscillum sp. MHG1-6 TaxID=2959627 RepID=UPI002158688E|nr:sorbosone dehydrogenase family protein [Marinoscillum sp. MHG1-6]